MDIEVILDAAETEAPGLRDLSQLFLDVEAERLGVPLDAASVMARRAEGVPEVHVTAAADELVRHLAAQPDALSDGGRAHDAGLPWCPHNGDQDRHG